MTGALVALRTALERRVGRPQRSRRILAGITVFLGLAALVAIFRAWTVYEADPSGEPPIVITMGMSVPFLFTLIWTTLHDPVRRTMSRVRRLIPEHLREEVVEGDDGTRMYALKLRRPWTTAAKRYLAGAVVGILILVTLAAIEGLISGKESVARHFWKYLGFYSAIGFFGLLSTLGIGEYVHWGRGAVTFDADIAHPTRALERATIRLRGNEIVLELNFEGMADPLPVEVAYPLWAASVLEREEIPVTFEESDS